MRTYAVVWRHGRSRGVGKLTVQARSLLLAGVAGCRELPFDEIVGVRVGRSAERVEGRPSLVLELSDGSAIALSPVAQPGAVTELADRLAPITA